MTPRAPRCPGRSVSPIAELVFAGEPGGRLRRLVVGAVTVLAMYAAAILIVRQLGRSGASVVAELAAQIHDAIAAERSVDIKLPPPPPPPPAEPEAPATPAAPAVAREHVRGAAHHAPAAPAQAGQIAAATDAPLDFTGSAFVVGSGSTYAGGTTTTRGTSRTPAAGAVAPERPRRRAGRRPQPRQAGVAGPGVLELPLARRGRRPSGRPRDRRHPRGRAPGRARRARRRAGRSRVRLRARRARLRADLSRLRAGAGRDRRARSAACPHPSGSTSTDEQARWDCGRSLSRRRCWRAATATWRRRRTAAPS